tara:strand:- start:401 stop:1078 length:678 start_codon:yes stop_codon:yes gene_type:complete
MSYKVEKLFKVDKESIEQWDFDTGDKYFFFSNIGVVSSGSFLGLIKKLFKYKDAEGIFPFIFNVYEKLPYSPRQLKKFKSANYLYSNTNNICLEKWAKLLTIDLYNHDELSPYTYRKFYIPSMTCAGLESFYFRGKNYEQLVRSFAFHYKNSISGHKILSVNNKNRYQFAKHFYDICIEVFGMNLFNKYDWGKFFDGGENFFFRQTDQKNVFNKSKYYKRRELVA